MLNAGDILGHDGGTSVNLTFGGGGGAAAGSEFSFFVCCAGNLDGEGSKRQ